MAVLYKQDAELRAVSLLPVYSDHLGYTSLPLSESLPRSRQMFGLWSQELWSRWRRRISAGGQWRWWKHTGQSVPIKGTNSEYLNMWERRENKEYYCVHVYIPQHTGRTFPPGSWQTSWRNQRQRWQRAWGLDWRVLPQWTMVSGLVRSRKMPQNWRWLQCWRTTSIWLLPEKDD